MSLSFPKFASAKTYIDQMTPEEDVLMKSVAGKQITNGDEAILLEAIEFYKKTYSSFGFHICVASIFVRAILRKGRSGLRQNQSWNVVWKSKSSL